MHTLIGPRFIDRKAPFHRLALPLSAGPHTAMEALQEAGLDYTILPAPTQYTLPDGGYNLPKVRTLLREPTPFDPTYRPFGMVTSDYEPLQNRDVAQALDSSGILNKWPLDAIGFFNQGQKVFLTLHVGNEPLAGEETTEYLLIIIGHDGGTATQFHYTPVRVACSNALLLGVKRASFSVSLTHQKGISDQLALNLSSLDRFDHTRQQSREALESLTTRPLLSETVQETLAFTYPLPTLPSFFAEQDITQLATRAPEELTPGQALSLRQFQAYSSQSARAEGLRLLARERYQAYNDQLPAPLRGTAYALYQAITEIGNHREGSMRKNLPDSVSVSTLFGPRAAEMARAYDYLQAAA